MCVVVDTCHLVNVFDVQNRDHAHFVPVFEWVTVGKGWMVYGGSKYISELRKLVRLLPLISELERARRVVNVGNEDVDRIARKLKGDYRDPKFDDEHIVAIVIVSGCRVVCTSDDVAIAYLKNPHLFRAYRAKRPKIYSSLRNRDLCCDKNLI